MRTVPCPQGDGTCTIPDPAVVARPDGLSLVPRADVERLFASPEGEAEGGTTVATMSAGLNLDRLRRVNLGRPLEELQDLAARTDLDTTTLARSILADSTQTAAVIVHCTCGHTYVLDP